MKRVFLVHGWAGSPEDKNWMPWLKTELEKKGFEVFIPRLPDADTPVKEKWIPALSAAVRVADPETYFVGHSMGCQTILRYVETLPAGSKIGGAVFVAGFIKRLSGLETEEEEKIAETWLGSPLDLKKIKSILGKSVAIFSDDDPFVPLENTEAYEKQLGSKIIIEKNKSHFDTEAGITKLPSALGSLLEISGEK